MSELEGVGLANGVRGRGLSIGQLQSLGGMVKLQHCKVNIENLLFYKQQFNDIILC